MLPNQDLGLPQDIDQVIKKNQYNAIGNNRWNAKTLIRENDHTKISRKTQRNRGLKFKRSQKSSSLMLINLEKRLMIILWRR